MRNPVVAARRRLKPLRAMAMLRRESDAAADAISKSIRAFLRQRPTREEAPWVRRIEALRDETYASVVPIEVIDYGIKPDERVSNRVLTEGRRIESTVGIEASRRSKGRRWDLVLMRLVREAGAERCLEMGACVGFSAAYQAAALELNGAGRLVTIEGAPAFAELARNNLDRLGIGRARVECGRFQDTLELVAAELAPLDFVFVDGHHDEQATIDYFNLLAQYLAPAAMVVFDDISWSTGMRRAWKTVSTVDGVKFAVDLGQLGICSVGRS